MLGGGRSAHPVAARGCPVALPVFVIHSDPRYASGASLAAADGLLPQVPGSYEVGRAPAIDDLGADRDNPAVWLR